MDEVLKIALEPAKVKKASKAKRKPAGKRRS
jgi:hypothetical protein